MTVHGIGGMEARNRPPRLDDHLTVISEPDSDHRRQRTCLEHDLGHSRAEPPPTPLTQRLIQAGSCHDHHRPTRPSATAWWVSRATSMPQKTSIRPPSARTRLWDLDNWTPPRARAGQPRTTRRQPRYEQASTAGPSAYQRSRTPCGSGEHVSACLGACHGSRWSRPFERSRAWSRLRRLVKPIVDTASSTKRRGVAPVGRSWAVTQPPGNTVYQVRRVRTRRAAALVASSPGLAVGALDRPVVSQVGGEPNDERLAPTRSWSRVNFDQPFLTLALPNVQPAGMGARRAPARPRVRTGPPARAVPAGRITWRCRAASWWRHC